MNNRKKTSGGQTVPSRGLFPSWRAVMKKILILSDSHGNLDNMIFAVRDTDPDLIIHLGDCWSDAVWLHRKVADIPMEHVPGNCDCTNEKEVQVIRVEDRDVMLCHGHTFNVKAGYLNLKYSAEERGVHAALFGHTHRVFYGTHNGVAYLNPGSIGSPPPNVPPSYGIMEIGSPDGRIRYDVKYIE